jgi:hypothetical protein
MRLDVNAEIGVSQVELMESRRPSSASMPPGSGLPGETRTNTAFST